MRKLITLGGGLMAAAALLALPVTAASASPARPAAPARTAAPRVVVPAVTCGTYGQVYDPDVFPYSAGWAFYDEPDSSEPLDNAIYTYEDPGGTNYCQQNAIGTWFELVQYGTNKCIAYDASNNTLYENTCGEYTWMYWHFITYQGESVFQSDYNNWCADDDNSYGPNVLEVCGGVNGNYQQYQWQVTS